MKHFESNYLENGLSKGGFRTSYSFLTHIFMVLLAVCVGILPFFINSTKLADGVFKDSILSVVEVNAVSEGIGESLGTAEFVDEDGTLVTNAHVVTYTTLGETTA